MECVEEDAHRTLGSTMIIYINDDESCMNDVYSSRYWITMTLGTGHRPPGSVRAWVTSQGKLREGLGWGRGTIGYVLVGPKFRLVTA